MSQHSQDTARSCCATEGTPIKFFNKRSAGLCQPFLHSSLLFFFYYWLKTRGTGRSLVGRSGGFLQVKSIRFTEAPETQRCQDQVWRSSANLGSLPGQDPVGFEPAEETCGRAVSAQAPAAFPRGRGRRAGSGAACLSLRSGLCSRRSGRWPERCFLGEWGSWLVVPEQSDLKGKTRRPPPLSRPAGAHLPPPGPQGRAWARGHQPLRLRVTLTSCRNPRAVTSWAPGVLHTVVEDGWKGLLQKVLPEGVPCPPRVSHQRD